MKNILLVLVLLTSAFNALQAQQENHYTQFMYNKLLINPAYAGARGISTATAIYRNQWAGFDGAPKSVLASFNTPVFSKRVGMGITLAQQKIGIEQDFTASAAYSYKLVSTEAVAIHAGIMGTIRSHTINFDKAKAVGSGDPSLSDQKTNNVYGNFGVGIYGVFANRFYAGLSVPRLYANTIGINVDPLVQTAKETQHYYAMFGGIFPINEDFSLMPALLVKYVKNAPASADINLNVDIRKKVTTGLSYRMGGNGAGESLDLLVFWQIAPQFGIGAAYDFTVSGLRTYNAGSMELMAQYDLVKKGHKKMSNPRFFL